jgi:Secretin and TonB N terminus short domain
MMMRRTRFSLLLLCMVSALASASLAAAADEPAKTFSIPAEDLSSALRQFARQSDQQILFSTDIVQGKSTPGLKGSHRPDSALAELLAGSGLAFSKSADGSLLIFVAAAKEASAPSYPGTVTQVTVSARRAQLQPRVLEFVTQVSALDGGGGLPRWQTPVCPLVTGLPKEDGEFLLERISEIGRAAGVPLAAEQCHANLFLFVIADPKQLLQSMEKRAREVTFGHAAPGVVDEFIATPRAAKVWYDSVEEAADSPSASYGFPNAAEITGSPGLGGASAGPQGGGLSSKVTTDWERSSRVARTTVWAFSYVYVVVDQKRLQGVTRRQLADYLAMVGLAQINPGAQPGDAPTILKLFDAAPQSAPAGMSEWDQAFLKSLYTVDMKVKVQKNEIALDMLREIVH